MAGPLKQAQLMANGGGRFEQRDFQSAVLKNLGPQEKPKFFSRNFEPVEQQLSVIPGPGHAPAKIRLVECARPALPKQANDTLRLVRKMGFQPLDKNLFQLKRQAQHHIGSFSSTGFCRCRQNRFHLVKVQPGYNGCQQHAGGNAG